MMDTKIIMASNTPMYTRPEILREIKGIIISALPMTSPESYIAEIDRGGLFCRAPHYVISNKGVVYQVLPDNYCARLNGLRYDKSYIQIVIACPSWIKFNGKKGFTVPLFSVAKEQMTKAYTSLVELCTTICTTRDLEPMKEKVIVGAKGLSDIETIWHGLGLPQTILNLKCDVRDNVNCGKGFYHDGVDYSYVFDPEYYKKEYPNIVDTVGSSNGALFEYFINFGMSKGQKGNANFDVYIYRANSPDLILGNQWSDYYRHYCTVGRLENRKCI